MVEKRALGMGCLGQPERAQWDVVDGHHVEGTEWVRQRMMRYGAVPEKATDFEASHGEFGDKHPQQVRSYRNSLDILNCLKFFLD